MESQRKRLLQIRIFELAGSVLIGRILIMLNKAGNFFLLGFVLTKIRRLFFIYKKRKFFLKLVSLSKADFFQNYNVRTRSKVTD